MKPKKILLDGRTEASALLFAHDGRKAQLVLLRSYSEDDEKRQGDLLEKKHKDFINFVIEDMIAERCTETAVALEFMDKEERESFTSSIFNFV